jgi:hypothetical protein
MITKDDLQRESAQSQKYAHRSIAALTIAAACCGSFVGLTGLLPRFIIVAAACACVFGLLIVVSLCFDARVRQPGCSAE